MNVLITGASKGLGKSLAIKFASQQYNVVLCARNAKELEALANFLESEYSIKARYYAADLGDKLSCKNFGEWAIKQSIDIDVLINNCGIFEPGSIYNEGDGILEKMIGVNLYSAYHLTRMLLPKMISRKSGHIFNICSIASLKAYANGGSYSISKYALAGFSKNLREEMKEFNIKVTTVYPGAVFTSSWDGSGVEKERILDVSDVSNMIFTSSTLSAQACVEDIVIRPQLGDL